VRNHLIAEAFHIFFNLSRKSVGASAIILPKTRLKCVKDWILNFSLQNHVPLCELSGSDKARAGELVRHHFQP